MNPYLPLSSSKRNTLGIASIVTVFLVWGVLSGFDIVGPAKLPAPWEVAHAFVQLIQSGVLLDATLWSLGRVVISALAVLLVGVPVGVLMGSSSTVNAVMSPIIDPFRSAPVVAILPILVMWLGIGEEMKIAFLFLGAVVYFVPMVRDAIKAVPQTYWISAYDLGATPFEATMKAVVPMAKPRIADAFVAAVSILWTYITVAEGVNAQSGLGQMIQNARRFSAMDQVFAGVIVIIALALITYRVMMAVKKKLYPWEVE